MKPFIGPQIIDDRATDPVPGRREYAPIASDWVDTRALTANTSETHDIPAGARFVNFSANGNFFAKFATGAGSIAVPNDVTNGTAPVLNMGTREIPGDATVIRLIAPQDTVLSIEFWS